MIKKKEAPPTKKHSCLPAIAWTLGIVGTVCLSVCAFSSPIPKPGLCYTTETFKHGLKVIDITQYGVQVERIRFGEAIVEYVSIESPTEIKCDSLNAQLLEATQDKEIERLKQQVKVLELVTRDIREEYCEKNVLDCSK